MKSVSKRTTSFTGIALLALWLSSFGLSYVHLGEASLVVALSIAVIKAALVILFFMELVTERFTVNVTLVTAVTLIAILLALIVADVALRTIPPFVPPG